MLTHLTPISSNEKTGPIPVSTTGAQSCPDACPLKKNGCYADGGPLAFHWKAVTEGKRGLAWEEFTGKVAKFPKGQLWRHNQAGDLLGANDSIDAGALAQLVFANAGRKGFTYTHKPVIGNQANADAVRAANAGGFTVNLSANNLEEADKLADLDIGPVVTILPLTVEGQITTPNGRKVVICPAQTRDDVTCATCQLCQKQKRAIVGFLSHGASKKKAEKVFYMAKG